MELYHVSCKEYNVGNKLTSNLLGETEYYQKSVESGQNWIDEYLDSKSPDGFPTSTSCLFAFDSIGNCYAFMKDRCPKGIKYYKVIMPNPISAPMCLTDALRKAKNFDEESKEKIAQEYWEPTQHWKYKEYLDVEMEILEVLQEPNFMEKIKGQNSYQYDFDLINKL